MSRGRIRGAHRRPLGATQADAAIAVVRAVADGLLPARPASCSVCGVAGKAGKTGKWSIERHHHSYELEHHLDVVDVCRKCHRAIHAGHIPEPLTGEVRTGDRIAAHGRPWDADRTALMGVLGHYPERVPFMSHERRRQVEQYADATFPAWRDALEYGRTLPGPVKAWDVVWRAFRATAATGFTIPPAVA